MNNNLLILGAYQYGIMLKETAEAIGHIQEIRKLPCS